MPPERKKRTNENKWAYWILRGGVAAALVALVYFLVKRKPEFLSSAWQVTKTTSASTFDAVRTSTNTGPVVAAVAGPVTAAVIGSYLSVPRQQQLEIKRDGRSHTFTEMNGAYNVGLRCLSAPPEEKQAKNYLKAAEEFRKAYDLLLGLESDEVSDRFKAVRLRDCLYNEALALFFIGIYEGNEDSYNALDSLNDILVEDPKDREALNLRGLIYLKLGKMKDAVKDFEQSLKISRAQPDVYICNLFAKSQLIEEPFDQDQKDASKPTKASYYKLIEECQRSSDEIFDREILFILAKIAFDKKDYASAISKVEFALVVRTPPHPGFYPEQIRFLNLMKDALLKIQDSLSESATYEIKPVQPGGKLKQYTLSKQNIVAKIDEANQKMEALKKELSVIESIQVSAMELRI